MKRCLPSAVCVCLTMWVAALAAPLSAQTVPTPWTSRDIGAPALAGGASHASGVFSLQGAGTDIWNTSDQFHFVYQPIAGDAEIVARVDSLTLQHAWSKAGVMIRASLQAGAAHGFALVSASRGVHFQYRVAAGGLSASVAGSTGAAPVWVRAVRTGTRVTTYWSSNGTSWSRIGDATIPLSTTAYFGLAVTSHNAAARSDAGFSSVRVTPLGLPAGQQSTDVGSPAISGSATYAAGVYSIRAAGTDIWNTSDQFHFVYQPVTGNVDLAVRVASIANTHYWAKAGVMIRESLDANARHASMLLSQGRGYAFQRRPDPGAYSLHTSGGSGTAPGWVRLVRSGDLFEAYRSSDGRSWTRVGSDTIPMADTVYVGLAVTSHNASAATTSSLDGFLLGGTVANRAPAVSLTSPAQGTSYTAPATIALSASASDPENQLSGVEFYAGSTRIGSDSTAPYTFSWSDVAAGTYTLTAVATDAAGASATSAAVTVTVTAPTTTTPPRWVVFGASADHASGVTSYVLKVYASGANPSTATPVASSDLGKPAPASNGDITVDRGTFFSGLAAGSYVATVTAVGPGGQTASAPISFTR